MNTASPFPQKVLVAGATGATGVRILARLRQLGVSVRVFTRERNRASRFPDIEVVEGDALAEPDCNRAVEDCDAVICAMGEHRTPKGRPIVDGDGIIHLADASEAAGARRFVLVSSLGVGETWTRLPFLVKWYFRAFGLVPILKEKERSENHLRPLDLDWTILYPAMLTNWRMKAEPLVVKDGAAGGTTTRQAVADVAIRCLGSPNSLSANLTVVDSRMRFTLSGHGPFQLDMPWADWPEQGELVNQG